MNESIALCIAWLMLMWCVFEYAESNVGQRGGWLFAILGWSAFLILELTN